MSAMTRKILEMTTRLDFSKWKLLVRYQGLKIFSGQLVPIVRSGRAGWSLHLVYDAIIRLGNI